MDGPIASAVVLPEELLPPTSPNGNKRRQPSISEQSAKRPRLDHDASNGGKCSTAETSPAAPVRRERGRERRLFGAVLGALSQAPSTTAAQRRRSEIEKRQLAQRKQESEDSEQRKAERIARRKVQRWKEQRRFEEQAMRLRHDNLLNMAHFLQTESKPQLYYKPWETSTEEENRIQDQIAKAHEVVDREVEEYEARVEQEANQDGHASHRDNVSHDAHSGKERHADALRISAATNGDANGSHNPTKDQETDIVPAEDPGHEAVSVDVTEHALKSTVASHETTTDDASKHDDDDNGEDVVEEAAEDTVIY